MSSVVSVSVPSAGTYSDADERHLLPAAAKMWNQPKTTEGTVDPRVVVNRHQAEALLTAVSYQGRVGPWLVAFFACLYYAGLRPSEAVELREDLNLDLPDDDGWGTLYLHGSAPTVGPAGHALAAAATAAS